MRNRSELGEVLSKVPSRHRTLLTGTPLQNNLSELFNLLTFLGEGAGGDDAFVREHGETTTSDQVRGQRRTAFRPPAIDKSRSSALTGPHHITAVFPLSRFGGCTILLCRSCCDA